MTLALFLHSRNYVYVREIYLDCAHQMVVFESYCIAQEHWSLKYRMTNHPSFPRTEEVHEKGNFQFQNQDSVRKPGQVGLPSL